MVHEISLCCKAVALDETGDPSLNVGHSVSVHGLRRLVLFVKIMTNSLTGPGVFSTPLPW